MTIIKEIKQYEVCAEKSDPVIRIQIPKKILKDLVHCAEDNGYSFELELAMRLSRSLEANHLQQQEDDLWALQAFEVISRA